MYLYYSSVEWSLYILLYRNTMVYSWQLDGTTTFFGTTIFLLNQPGKRFPHPDEPCPGPRQPQAPNPTLTNHPVFNITH